MKKFKEIAGQKFGRWTAIRRTHSIAQGDKSTKWLCRCDCGKEGVVYLTNLTRGGSTSCGCYQREVMAAIATTHGHCSNGTESKEFVAWRRMKDRCTQPSNLGFRRYGARGITVCDRWLNSFENFLADMGPRPAGTSLDRKNNDLGYSKDNCRWATRLVQSNNTSTNRFFVIDGQRDTIANWARRLGVEYNQMLYRANRVEAKANEFSPRVAEDMPLLAGVS